MTAPTGFPTSSAGRRSAWLLLVATLLLVGFYYFVRADAVGVSGPGRGWTALTRPPLTPPLHFVAAALLLGIIPVLAARRLTGLGPGALGLGVGRWRAGLAVLAGGIPIAILAGRVGALSPAMRAVYPLDSSLSPELLVFARGAALQFLYYGAWEILFRGVLLFGLLEWLGELGANLTQTSLSVLAHFGRALNETAASLPAGLLFGWITLRLRSIWYVTILHWVVGMSLDWFILTT